MSTKREIHVKSGASAYDHSQHSSVWTTHLPEYSLSRQRFQDDSALDNTTVCASAWRYAYPDWSRNQLLRFRIQKLMTTCLTFWKRMSNSQHDSWLSQHLLLLSLLSPNPLTFFGGDLAQGWYMATRKGSGSDAWTARSESHPLFPHFLCPSVGKVTAPTL